MAAPSFIGEISGNSGNADDLTLDISAIGHTAGDVAIALVAYGDPAGAGALPAGWFQLTGAAIAEDVELVGELLYRFLDEDDSEFVFTGATAGAIVASIAVYRGVDTLVTLDAQNETAETSGSTSHVAPAVTTTVDDTVLLSAYFLWYSHSGVTPPGGTTERADESATATGGGSNRDLGVNLADESFATAGATGTRTATTTESGLANNILIALSPADKERTAFDRELGTTQGRIDPADYANPDGTYAFCLGRDIAGQFHDLSVGDYIEISQTADFDNVKIARITVNLVGPDPDFFPGGVRWKFRILIDGTERASAFVAQGKTVQREMAVNVEQLTPATLYTLSLRLELV